MIYVIFSIQVEKFFQKYFVVSNCFLNFATENLMTATKNQMT